jgi:hypothetical protein
MYFTSEMSRKNPTEQRTCTLKMKDSNEEQVMLRSGISGKWWVNGNSKEE